MRGDEESTKDQDTKQRIDKRLPKMRQGATEMRGRMKKEWTKDASDKKTIKSDIVDRIQ